MRLGFLVLLLVGTLLGCSRPQDNTLRVGMELAYPPFETIDANGQPAGISVELAQALGEYLGRPVVIENIPFVGLIPALKSGRIDCIISSMTDTPERRQSIRFSDPYLTIGLALLTGAHSNVEELSDLDQPSKTVVVRQGTTGEVFARANLKNARILAVEKENAAVLEVVQGRADGFIYDQMSVWKNWQQHPEKTRAILQPMTTEGWAVGLRSDDEVLQKQINDFLIQYRQNGGFDRLGDTYLKDQKEAFQKAGIPFYF